VNWYETPEFNSGPYVRVKDSGVEFLCLCLDGIPVVLERRHGRETPLVRLKIAAEWHRRENAYTTDRKRKALRARLIERFESFLALHPEDDVVLTTGRSKRSAPRSAIGTPE
jgi:hypothetical protein